MITVTTPLRKKFAMLNPALQEILLKDLGFLTLETELEQLKFVEAVLLLPKRQTKVFIEKMRKKQKSKAYAADVEKFEIAYRRNVLPLLQGKVRKAVEARDRKTADERLGESLKNV